MSAIQQVVWGKANGFIASAVVSMDDMGQMLLPVLFLFLSQCTKHLQQSTIQSFGRVALGISDQHLQVL